MAKWGPVEGIVGVVSRAKGLGSFQVGSYQLGTLT